MSIEIVLFLIVGSISIGAAVGMLLSENAVISALFLILNFICVGFLYVMLDSSFLALVQVAVYAGAIMVLFLFVIMLLGAEKISGDARRFRWLPWMAFVLSAAFLITVSIALIAGKMDDREFPEPDARLRVVHVAPDLGVVDVYLGDTLIDSALDFKDRSEAHPPVTAFKQVAPGEYELRVLTEESPTPQTLGTITLTPGQVQTVILFGVEQPQWVALDENLETMTLREGRLIVFNAYTAGSAVNLVDTGADFAFDSEEDAINADVIAANLEPGMASELMVRRTGEPTWAFVLSDNVDEIVARVRHFEIRKNTVNLIVLAGERNAINNQILDPVVIPVETPADARFGGPVAVGTSLFVDYALPFEMVAVLLLAAMVGVIILTQRQVVSPKPGRKMRHKVSRPLTSVIAAQVGGSVVEEDEDAG